jgi:hypothetical protein
MDNAGAPYSPRNHKDIRFAENVSHSVRREKFLLAVNVAVTVDIDRDPIVGQIGIVIPSISDIRHIRRAVHSHRTFELRTAVVGYRTARPH